MIGELRSLARRFKLTATRAEKASSNSDLQLLDADELGQFFDFAFVQFAETEFEDFLQIDGKFVQGFGLGMGAGNSRNHANQQAGLGVPFDVCGKFVHSLAPEGC